MEPTPEQREKWDLEQIKQSRSRLNARPIASVMRRLLSTKEYGAMQASEDLHQTWQRMVGEKLGPATRLGKINRGVLLVEVNSSQALQELHFQQARLLKQLQSELPQQKIIRLNFRSASF